MSLIYCHSERSEESYLARKVTITSQERSFASLCSTQDDNGGVSKYIVESAHSFNFETCVRFFVSVAYFFNFIAIYSLKNLHSLYCCRTFVMSECKQMLYKLSKE